MIAPQHHNRASDCHDQAPDVEARYAFPAKNGAGQKSSDNRTHDAQSDVKPEAQTALVDDLAANEARDEAQYEPANNSHNAAPALRALIVAVLGPLSLIACMTLYASAGLPWSKEMSNGIP